jgi:hypothetical protein
MIVILYFDNGYYKWSGPFLKSLQTHEPKAKVVIFGFNLTEKQETRLENVENVIEVINQELKWDEKKSYLWKFQLTCQKGHFVLETMKKYPGEDLYVIMDIDMLMVNPLDEMKESMRKYDVGLITIGETKVAGGFLVFKERATNFVTDFHRQTYTGKLYQSKDQKTLAKLYKRYENQLEFLNLSRKYIDHTFKLNSFIWSAHKQNFGVKDTRLKLFSYVSKSMAAGMTLTWKKYLKNWKENVKTRRIKKSRKRAKAKKALKGKK